MDRQLVSRFHRRAHRAILKRPHGIETILSATIAGDRSRTVAERTQDDGAMSDGLIAGNRDRALERSAWRDRECRHGRFKSVRMADGSTAPVPAWHVRAPSRLQPHHPHG